MVVLFQPSVAKYCTQTCNYFSVSVSSLGLVYDQLPATITFKQNYQCCKNCSSQIGKANTICPWFGLSIGKLPSEQLTEKKGVRLQGETPPQANASTKLHDEILKRTLAAN